jgi:flagellar biosynthesis/type III secretory pathway chaperone
MMAANSDTPAGERSTETALQRLLGAVESLEQCLHAETQALIAGEVGALLAAVEHKRRALHAVESILQEPQVQALFLPPSARHEGLGRPLARSPEWPRLLDRLERCYLLNQAAGGAIAASRRNTDDLLRVLGHATDAATYDVDGNASHDKSSRGLAVC